jgi:hypothetical protein
MLGPLKASRIAIGDIESNSLSGSAGLRRGKGLVISNNEIHNEITVENIIVEGEYTPGWDVELYQDNILLGIQTIGDDGRYEFNDITSFSGRNTFTLKFYGPGGREYSEERVINVGALNSEQLFNYKLAIQDSRPVFFDEIKPDTLPFNTRSASVNTAIKLADFFRVTMNYQHVQEELVERQTTNFGFLLSSDKLFFQASASKDDLGSISSNYGFSADSSYLNLDFSFAKNDINDIYPGEGAKNYNTKVSSNLLGVPIGLVSKKTVTDALEKNIHTFAVSGSLLRTAWALRHNYLSDENLTTHETSRIGNGTITFARSSSFGSYRVAGLYETKPNQEFQSMFAGASVVLADYSQLNISTTYDRQLKFRTYSIGIGWRLPLVQISPSITYNNLGNFSGLIRFAVSLNKQDTGKGIEFKPTRTSAANSGNIRLRMFEDLNRDGKLSKDEPLLKGGKAIALQANRRGQTDDNGNLWLENVRAWIPTDIEYDIGSITSAEVKYAGKPFSTIVHPGSTTAINLPFLRVGEIEGSAFFLHPDKSKTVAANKILRLIDQNGEVADKQRSSYDGYFLFQGVLPGKYSIQIDGSNYVQPPAYINITEEGNVVSGVELVLQPESLTPPTLF